jgi:hypothetical protein
MNTLIKTIADQSYCQYDEYNIDLQLFTQLILAEVQTVLQELHCGDGGEWDRALSCVRQLLEHRFEINLVLKKVE